MTFVQALKRSRSVSLTMQRRGQALSTQLLVVILCPILAGEGRTTAAYVS